MPVPVLVCAIITLLSAGISLGFSIAGLRGSSGAARIASLYAFARSAALFVVAIVALISGVTGIVIAAALAMTIVQAIDAYIGVVQHNRGSTIGPIVLAVLNAAALVWVLLP